MADSSIQNTFNKGINQDVNPRFQPSGTYRHALNKKKRTDRFYSGGLTNELRNQFAASIPGQIVGYHRLEERNSTLFFHINGGSSISIYNHDTDEVTFVASDSEFGCDWGFSTCNWISSTSKTLAPCNDLIIYWSSALFYYKANIDELLDPIRRLTINKLENPCEYFELMKCISGPRLKLRLNRGGGRDLTPGQYFAVAQSVDESGNTSNWTAIEGPVYLKGKYNKPSDFSPNSISIQARSLSKEYTKIRIAVIPPIGSQEQDVAYLIYDGSYNTNGVSCDYYSPSQHKEIIPLGRVLAKDIKFLRGKSLITDDSRLHLYKTLQEFNPPVQKWAQQATAYVVSYAVPASHAHRFKSLSRDEVYALGVVYQYCDQTVTVTGHIDGPGGGINDISCGTCNLPSGQTGNNATRIQRYVDYNEVTNTYCFESGNQSTIRENNVPVACGEEPIEPRTDDGDLCVDHTTDKEAVQGEIDAIQTTNDDLDDCLDCAQATTGADLDQAEGFFTRKIEQLTDLFKTDDEVADDCSTGTNTTIKEAARQLYDEAIKTAELDEEITYRTGVTKVGGSNVSITQVSGGTLITGITKGEDCVTEEIEPILLEKWSMAGWESSLTYSEALDCEGQPLYGDLAGLPIRHHKTPDVSKIPLTITSQSGVESRFDPSNIPGKDTYVVILGLLVENIYVPSYENGEIPKPLDENNPWKIVIGKRERHNQSTVYRGYFVPTFEGKIGGKTYAVPRHAASAYPNVDRSIDDDGSHLGTDWDTPIYVFHSPDLGAATEFVNGDYVKLDGYLGGDGNVYGLWAEGKDVAEEVNRKDRRGARSALNLATFVANPFSTCLQGADFAEFNQNLQNPQGIDFPLLNKYRESSIMVQTAEPFPDLIGIGQFGVQDNKDHSFNVGGLDHEYPTSGVVWVGSIKRFNTQQYGSLESLQYIDIGLTGRTGQTSIRGLTGDMFVQKWSHKRSSYVSDKVGNYLNEDFPITATTEYLGSPDSRKRGVCDPPNRRGYRMKEFMGFWNELELPESGDKRAPKNMANGHPTLSWDEIAGIIFTAGNDLYYWRTLNHLNHLFVESETNLYYRSTSPAPTREIFYEELQGIDVDSSLNKVDPEDAWLDDWHNEHLQPSVKQLNRKALLRFLLVVGMPMLMAGGVAGIETALEGAATMFVSPFFGVLWLLLVYNIFTNKKLGKLLGIPPCKTDDEGAQDEDNTKGLRDNWNSYNYGFSAVNDNNNFVGMPLPYHTCKCEKFSNIIYSSNKQISTSPYDAWSNFQALSFTGIPADSGLLERMFVWSSGVYAQTTDSLFRLQYIGQNPSFLGSEIFAPNPRRMLEGAVEGFGGTTDPNSAITCRLGDISMDYEGKDIRVFGGESRSLTHPGSGLSHYWYNNFNFCSSGCRDQNSPNGIHYAFGYDPEHELLLITKKDGSNSFTWSYDLRENHYVSEHSFVPDFYFWDRNKLFGVKDSQIYRFNQRGGYTEYFGEKFNSSVEFVVTNGDYMTYRYSNVDTEVNIHNKANVPDLFDREETYDYLTAWNEKQTTSRLPLVLENQQDGTDGIKDGRSIKLSRRNLGKWKLDNIKANQLTSDDNITFQGTCGKNETLNEANVNFDKDDQESKEFSGKYLRMKLEYEKNDRQIILLSTNTHISKPDES